MKTPKSNCCNAEVNSVCGDKNPDEGSTWHFECVKCGNACDIITTGQAYTENKTDWREELSEDFDYYKRNKIPLNQIFIRQKMFIQELLNNKHKEVIEKIEKLKVEENNDLDDPVNYYNRALEDLLNNLKQ